MPEKCFRVWLNEDGIFELPEDCNNISKRSVVDRYIDGPNSTNSAGKFSAFDTLCFAEFSRYLQIPNIKKMINNQKNVTMNQYQVCLI